jgi:DNA-directed RNA polymerase sigma subunit (sigma70/sigma32)
MRANRTLRYFAAHIKKLPFLTFREKYVLQKRSRGETLEKIGLKFSVTEARIRQIEKEAIKKIKSGTYQQKLFDKQTSEN